MSSKREDEKNEKIIRGLMKLPPNRRCINCNNLGPQYICTNFWTFVCMTCSGIHREFTHRVKSVSLAKFTSQEIEALQKGGNQRAKEIFLKNWDVQRFRLPDSNNPDRIRQFIKDTYVDRKYSGGTISEKPPRDMQNFKIHEDNIRRANSYHSYSQSPPYEHEYEDRLHQKQTGFHSRKPGSDHGFYDKKFFSFSYSPGRLREQMFEDRSANESYGSRLSEYSVSSGGDFLGSEVQSPNFQKDDGTSSPHLPPVRDILVEGRCTHQQVEAIPFPSIPLVKDSSSTTWDPFNTALKQPTSTLSSSSDLFANNNTNIQPSTPRIQIQSVVTLPENKGWATFDQPQHTTIPIKTNDELASTFPDHGKHGEKKSFVDTEVIMSQVGHPSSLKFSQSSSGSLFGTPIETIDVRSTLSWCAFDDSIATFDNQRYCTIPQDFNKSGFHGPNAPAVAPISKEPFDAIFPSSSFDAPMEGGVPSSHILKHQSNNPFDLPFDAEMESNNMFLDMSSMQTALPLPPFLEGTDQPWYHQKSVNPYIPLTPQEGLPCIPAPIFNPSQSQNIPSRSSATSLGGNPFA